MLIDLWVSSICFRRADGGISRHSDAIAVDRIDGNRADDDGSAAIACGLCDVINALW